MEQNHGEQVVPLFPEQFPEAWGHSDEQHIILYGVRCSPPVVLGFLWLSL